MKKKEFSLISSLAQAIFPAQVTIVGMDEETSRFEIAFCLDQLNSLKSVAKHAFGRIVQSYSSIFWNHRLRKFI